MSAHRQVFTVVHSERILVMAYHCSQLSARYSQLQAPLCTITHHYAGIHSSTSNHHSQFTLVVHIATICWYQSHCCARPGISHVCLAPPGPAGRARCAGPAAPAAPAAPATPRTPAASASAARATPASSATPASHHSPAALSSPAPASPATPYCRYPVAQCMHHVLRQNAPLRQLRYLFDLWDVTTGSVLRFTSLLLGTWVGWRIHTALCYAFGLGTYLDVQPSDADLQNLYGYFAMRIMLVIDKSTNKKKKQVCYTCQQSVVSWSILFKVRVA